MSNIIERNRAPIVFYAFVQFNVFFSFTLFSKFDLLTTVIGFGIILLYSFLFYPLILKYERTESSI